MVVMGQLGNLIFNDVVDVVLLFTFVGCSDLWFQCSVRMFGSVFGCLEIAMLLLKANLYGLPC